jgi:hypothetical protein
VEKAGVTKQFVTPAAMGCERERVGASRSEVSDEGGHDTRRDEPPTPPITIGRIRTLA